MKRKFVIALSAMVVGVSGCGDDGSDAETEVATVTETVEQPESEVASTTTPEVPTESAVTGPAECEKTEAGSDVVVNSGSITCSEAVKVATNSSGPNNARGPAGWDCSGFADRADGTPVQGAGGYACSKGSARISVILGAAPKPTGSGASTTCPEGQEPVDPVGPAQPHCVVIEVQGEAFGQ